MKKVICLLCAILMMTLGCGAALASSVSYQGGAEKFVFLPSDDLFQNFKGVLPGDVIQQTITVQNNTSKQVRIYLRADKVSDNDVDFLSKLHLQVTAKSGDIFDAQASETAQLTNNTLLGTFKKTGSTTLTVTLTVPAELGNEYMGRLGAVPWTFLAEEIDEVVTPSTGDWFNPAVWIGIAVLILCAMTAVVLVKRRKTASK